MGVKPDRMPSRNPTPETIPIEVGPMVPENLVGRRHGASPPHRFRILVLSGCRPQPSGRSLISGSRNRWNARLHENRVQLPDEQLVSARCPDGTQLVLPHEIMIVDR